MSELNIRTEWHGSFWEAYLEENPDGPVGVGDSKDDAVNNLMDILEEEK
jgi:hypothetical protein